uniref:Endonuclease/exonuclease/phosphatase domain-containing protein n=1 Tax=Timema poppense TaxID=170557 RepID=A0A7R9GZQ7_TIMPO|nr:unnamed protein product [Timema poppensis]
MSLLQWNCRGFYARVEEIKQQISSLHPSILCLQETHFRPTDNPMLCGYDVYRTDKPFFDCASEGPYASFIDVPLRGIWSHSGFYAPELAVLFETAEESLGDIYLPSCLNGSLVSSPVEVVIVLGSMFAAVSSTASYSNEFAPGDENELREGFGGHMTRLHMIKRRNRTVSESYSMDVRQRPNAQQLQKRVRRFSGGSGIGTQKRADLPGFVGSGHIRTHSFGSERQRTYSASESHNRGKSYHKEVKADGSHSKARRYLSLRALKALQTVFQYLELREEEETNFHSDLKSEAAGHWKATGISGKHMADGAREDVHRNTVFTFYLMRRGSAQVLRDEVREIQDSNLKRNIAPTQKHNNNNQLMTSVYVCRSSLPGRTWRVSAFLPPPDRASVACPPKAPLGHLTAWEMEADFVRDVESRCLPAGTEI